MYTHCITYRYGIVHVLYCTSCALQKAFKRETEAENWIQKYDHDLGEQQVNNVTH